MKSMMKKLVLLALLASMVALCLSGCGDQKDDTIVLRVSNWEEYIDEGDWGEDEAIELEDGTVIFGENALTDDFETWFYETYGKKVRVEYSTFGTNEEMYNQLTIGDVYDLVCPSEYMIMKMLREDMLLPYPESFADPERETNYYAKNVSPYIKGVFKDLNIDGSTLDKYAAGYMWGTLGIVYNPEEVTEEEADHWSLLTNPKFEKRITIKDSVRDAFFGAAAIATYDEITDPSFVGAKNYHELLSEALNRTDQETVDQVQKVLTDCKENVYSFETDAGKADMVTGKVIANEQWSGDAVYTMDQADEDELTLCYSAPSEGTNLWFDGWVMLKDGIGEDPDKLLAAQAFVNYLSMPENAIRNMYYIGYSSVISGTEDGKILQYIDYNYGAEEDEEETIDYKIGYFFDMEDPDADEEYCVTAPLEQRRRQLFAQYPPKEVVDRSVVMACFDEEGNDRINRMWTNVRCFDLGRLFGK